MKDEEYVFRQDVGERSKTARGAHNKRTHCGKGGRVKLPSDYMTKKEIKAMSGECKSYRLNEPMYWNEFNSMPDDIKVSYIKLIREKFGATDTALAKMMEVNTCTFSKEINRLGISRGKRRAEPWDKEGFLAWWHRVPAKPEEPVESIEEPVEVAEDIKPMKWEVFKLMPDVEKVYYINQIRKKFNASDSQIAIMLEKNRRDFATEIKRLGLGLGRDRIGGMTHWDKEGFYKWIGKPIEVVKETVETVEEVSEEFEGAAEEVKTLHIPPIAPYKSCIPTTGQLTFEGNVDEICNTLKTLLNGASVRMFLKWNLMEVEHG